jgi:hypothetical protein
MNQQQINDLTTKCHEAAKANGWHEQKRTNNEFILLIQSEMFECFEAYRKNKYASILSFESLDKEDFVFKSNFEQNIKDTFEDELADTAIRIFDCAGAFDLEITELQDEQNQFSFIFNFTEFVKISAGALDNHLLKGSLILLLSIVTQIAESQEIDLLRHIELKLEYNKTRGIRHGNKIL